MESASSPGAAPRVPEGVDEADMAFPITETPGDTAAEPTDRPPLDTIEQQEIGASQQTEEGRGDGISLPLRPGIQRGKSIPAPQQAPPPAPPQELGNPTDSLSLAQLKRLVNEVPRVEPTPYAFDYEDAASFPEELEEWFAYTADERDAILNSLSSFSQVWTAFKGQDSGSSAYEQGSVDWCTADPDDREAFMAELLSVLASPRNETKLTYLEALVYLTLGSWYETANDGSGSKNSHNQKESVHGQIPNHLTGAVRQIEWIRRNVDLLCKLEGLQIIFDLFRSLCEHAS